MSMTANGSAGSVSEINVTPLIDVLLVLLIIFMVIVPIAPKGMDAEALQPSKSDVQPPPNREVVLQVRTAADRRVTYSINQTQFAKTDLQSMLGIIFASRADKQMFLKGDKDLSFTQISEVIDEAHRAGVDRIGLITPGSALVR